MGKYVRFNEERYVSFDTNDETAFVFEIQKPKEIEVGDLKNFYDELLNFVCERFLIEEEYVVPKDIEGEKVWFITSGDLEIEDRKVFEKIKESYNLDAEAGFFAKQSSIIDDRGDVLYKKIFIEVIE